jgi:N-acetylglucosamine-6-phosphate deacetylase
MLALTSAPLLEVIQMMTSTPARIMGIDRTKGSLAAGKDADIVIFNDDIRVKMTIINGKIVYNSAQA